MRSRRLPPALLVDYGQVVSLPQPPAALEAMAAAAGLEPEELAERYWRHRPAYDRGQSPASYWSAVAGRRLDDGLLVRLSRCDVASWRHLNEDVLVVLREVRDHGCQLALLSNAPDDLAQALVDEPALAIFDRLFFSARLQAVKPEPGAYLAVLEDLARPPSEVLFIDDRPANVEAAEALGMQGLLFRSAAGLRARLLG